MRGGAWLLAATLVLGACTSELEDVDPVALEAALVGTRAEAGEGRPVAEPLPLSEAEPHRAVILGQLRLQKGDGPLHRITVTREVDRGPGGAFRVLDLRAWSAPRVAERGLDSGREMIFDGKRLAVRRAWGPWMERETLGGHEERLLREAHDALPSALAAFGPYLRWTSAPDGEPRLAGLDVRWEEASLDEGVAPRDMSEEDLAALRDHAATWTGWMAATHRPTAVTGRIARRTDTGELVAGTLTIDGMARVEGEERWFAVRVSRRLLPLPGDADFTVPADALPARRERTWRMIEAVLGDELAAVYRRGPAASAKVSPP